jgi:hypothetical protein
MSCAEVSDCRNATGRSPPSGPPMNRVGPPRPSATGRARAWKRECARTRQARGAAVASESTRRSAGPGARERADAGDGAPAADHDRAAPRAGRRRRADPGARRHPRWQRRRRGRQRARRSCATWRRPAGCSGWGRTCVREGRRRVGRNARSCRNGPGFGSVERKRGRPAATDLASCGRAGQARGAGCAAGAASDVGQGVRVARRQTTAQTHSPAPRVSRRRRCRGSRSRRCGSARRPRRESRS